MSANNISIALLETQLARLKSEDHQHIDKGGEPPDDSDMEKRVQKLEGTLSAFQIDVAVIKSNYATKADVSDAKNSIIMWVVSAILLAQLLPAILKKFGL